MASCKNDFLCTLRPPLFFFTHTHFAYTDLDTNINKPNTEAVVELTETSGLSQNSAKYLVEPSESTTPDLV